jgi:hypothetical protein
MAQRRALRDRQQQMTRINDNGFRSQLTRPTKSSPNAFFYECPATRAKILKNQNQNLWGGKGGNEENCKLKIEKEQQQKNKKKLKKK